MLNNLIAVSYQSHSAVLRWNFLSRKMLKFLLIFEEVLVSFLKGTVNATAGGAEKISSCLNLKT